LTAISDIGNKRRGSKITRQGDRYQRLLEKINNRTPLTTTRTSHVGEATSPTVSSIIEELILLAHDQLQPGQSATDVFSRLFAKQGKEVPV
jgi:hypothetical protein